MLKLMFNASEDDTQFAKDLDRMATLVVTPGILQYVHAGLITDDKIGSATIELIEYEDPLDYLQVAYINDKHKIWIIDDGVAITWLLPEEY